VAASLSRELGSFRAGSFPITSASLRLMKKQIVRVSILQSSKIVTVLYFLVGLIYLLIGVPMIIFGNNQIRIMGMVYCAMPILMAVLGFIGFVICAAVYNLLAQWLGGMEFDVIDVPDEQTIAGPDTEQEVLI
jgi:hypothetical protein